MRSDLLFSIPLGDWIETGVRWMIKSWDAFFDSLSVGLEKIYEWVYWALSTPSFWVLIAIFAVVAFFAHGWKLAVGTVAGFLLIYGMGQWDNAMSTLALVVEASTIAILIGVPLGILAARVRVVSRIVRPLMDFLQTMPAFVYLIPFVMIFSTGVVSGVVATVLFAIAPSVRFTELGIRQVDPSVVEASYALSLIHISEPTRLL